MSNGVGAEEYLAASPCARFRRFFTGCEQREKQFLAPFSDAQLILRSRRERFCRFPTGESKVTK
jgi:hypothetical protein